MPISTTEYHTRSFQEAIPPPMNYVSGMAKDQGKDFVLLATTLGQYFEGAFYEALSNLANGGSGGGKMNAVSAKAEARLNNANALSFLRTSRGAYMYTPEQVQQLTQVATQQANSLARAIHNKIIQDMLKNSNKHYEVNQIGDGADKVVGDIEVVINGKSVIYEVKYQLSEGSQVRYEELADGTLFSSGRFADWLAGMKDKYWTYKTRPQQWTYQIRRNALSEFMGMKDGDAEAFRRMLQKGVAENRYMAKNIVYAANLQTGGDQVRAETILDLEALYQYVQMSGIKYVATNQAYFKIMAAEEEIGTFGISKFQAGTPGSEPSLANFNFEMYLAQKLFI